MTGGENNTLRGGALMALTMALYTANDALVKLLGRDMGLGAIITFRGLLITLFMFALVLLAPGHGPDALRWLKNRVVLMRAFWDTAVTILYLSALMHMPIANILAVMNLAPLLILPLAAWRLGERVGPGRIAAVAVGFAGALLVVRPGTEGFNGWAALAFLAMAGVAGRDISTRFIPPGAPSLVVALANILMVQAAGMALWALEPASGPPTDMQWMTLSACAVFLGTGYVLIIAAVRIAPVNETAIWRYTIIVWGVLAGWLAFGQFPDAPALAGIALIMGGSIYVSLHEWRGSRRKDPAAR